MCATAILPMNPTREILPPSFTGFALAASLVLFPARSAFGQLIVNGGTTTVTTALSYPGGMTVKNGTLAVESGGSITGFSNTLVGATIGDIGTLSITSSGTVSDFLGSIGDSAGSTGLVTVDGFGSKWSNATNLTVGQSGAGTLTISSSGTVSDTIGTVGKNVGSTGSVTVDGSGSKWTHAAILSVGQAGAGNLAISNGGTVSSNQITIGNATGGTGLVTVNGAGSSVHIDSGLLQVGTSGTGSLVISNGGAVTSLWGNIGAAAGGTGLVTVDGAGSNWSNSLAIGLRVGISGTGSLTISNGGTVAATSVTIAANAGSSGTVTMDGGVLNAPAITINAGGTLNFNSSSLTAGAINSSTITNAGQFTINTRAPISGSADSRTIGATVTNQVSGRVDVNLDNNASVAFSGTVNNDGYFKVTQLSGTSGGSTTFGTFNNHGTFVQDPTTTHFDTLNNLGLFEAGLGDTIIVDHGLFNGGTLNLTGSTLDSAAGLVNDGTFNIFGGATIDGAYSGTGSLVFHVGSTADILNFDDLFTGNIEIIFDGGFSPFSSEQFIHFGQGANLTSLLIGGTAYDAGIFSGAGFLEGNGHFVATSSVPDTTNTLFSLFPILFFVIAARRRKTA